MLLAIDMLEQLRLPTVFLPLSIKDHVLVLMKIYGLNSIIERTGGKVTLCYTMADNPYFKRMGYTVFSKYAA